MGNNKKYDETDIFLLENNDLQLDSDIDIKEMDEAALNRITQITLNRAAAYETEKNVTIGTKNNRYRRWFGQLTGIGRAAAVIFCIIALSGAALGFIALLRQYVPGLGIVSDSSKLQVLASPYTVWKGDYYLRITSLSYNPDTKVLKFTAESNGADGMAHGKGDKILSSSLFFKEKWSQATPFEESLGKGYYNYGNPAAEYHDEFKLSKGLESYYLELDVVDTTYDENGKAVYTEKPQYIVMSFDDFKLVPASEADELEDFGQVVESNGVRAVAVSRWDNGKLYADILFKSNSSDETVTSFNSDEKKGIDMISDEGKKYKNISGQSTDNGWKYLLFETYQPVNGTVKLNSLFIEKSVDKMIRLDLPRAGETKMINREVEIDGFKIIIESISAYKDTKEDEGGKIVTYPLPDNEIGIDVKCRILKDIVNGRIADDKSYINGEIIIDNAKSTSKGFSWGSSGLCVNGRFKSEDLENVTEITLSIDNIMLTVAGNWTIPVKVK